MTTNFLLTLESAIIQNVKDKPDVKLCNAKQIGQYSYYYDLAIKNIGFPALIDREIIVERNK